MIRLLVIAALLAIACRWLLGKWPWDYLKAPSSRDRSLASARRMLGVRRNASRQDIRDAHRRMAADLHPDRGGSDPRLAEVNAARDVLLAELERSSPTQPPEPPR